MFTKLFPEMLLLGFGQIAGCGARSKLKKQIRGFQPRTLTNAWAHVSHKGSLVTKVRTRVLHISNAVLTSFLFSRSAITLNTNMNPYVFGLNRLTIRAYCFRLHTILFSDHSLLHFPPSDYNSKNPPSYVVETLFYLAITCDSAAIFGILCICCE